MEDNGLYRLGYGLYVVTAKAERDDGCMVNTVMQVTQTPEQILVAVNKHSLTHDYIRDGKKVNVSILAEDADMDMIAHFGYQTGKNENKFDDFEAKERSKNGLYYITEGTNAFLSADVVNMIDCDTHTLFIGKITENHILNDKASMTYAFYQDNVKEK